MEIPTAFKATTPFIRRAEECDRDPRGECRLIAYYCRAYAMEVGIKLGDKSAAGKQFLIQLITKLEEEKAALAGFTEDEGKTVLTSFADDVFSRADDEDRAGLADKGTAKAFYAAGVFYDTLQQFGPLGDQAAQRRKYAKWKAAEILKAIKEGRPPAPGGFGEDAPDPMASIPDVAAAPPPGQGTSPGSSTLGVGAGGDGGGAYSGTSNLSHGYELVDAIPAAPTTVPATAYPMDFGSGLPPPQQQPAAPADNSGSGGGGGGYYQRPADANAYSRADLSPPRSSSTSSYIPAPAPAPTRGVSPPPSAASASGGGLASAIGALGAAVGGVMGGGSSGRRGGGRVPQENMNDALELCKFAISALEHRDPTLAAERLEQALQRLR